LTCRHPIDQGIEQGSIRESLLGVRHIGAAKVEDRPSSAGVDKVVDSLNDLVTHRFTW
jgi:hypothetical protein